MKLRKFYLILFVILLHSSLSSREVKEKKYYLSVVAIFRDEARFLKEWLEYHLLVGVEHFYLCNHLSQDHCQEVLQPYIKQGIVELIHEDTPVSVFKEWTELQKKIYRKLLWKSKKETKWLAIIDLDEFLLPVQEDNLKEVLKDYEDFGGLCANWVLFGTSYVQRIPENALMIEKLCLRAPLDFIDPNAFIAKKPLEDHRIFKSIVQPERVQFVESAHYCLFLESFFHVDENKQPFDPKKFRTPAINLNVIRINHYWTRDEQFLKEIRLPRMEFRKKQHKLEILPFLNLENDDKILRFVPALRKRMFGL